MILNYFKLLKQPKASILKYDAQVDNINIAFLHLYLKKAFNFLKQIESNYIALEYQNKN